jgi:hypothetical protein
MSLINLIDRKIKEGQYYDTDSKWRQFIIDHKLYLKNNSIKRYPSETYLNKYKYDLSGYLRSLNMPASCTWIVRIINDMPTDKEFVNIKSIYVPELPIIKDLFKTYRTIYYS